MTQGLFAIRRQVSPRTRTLLAAGMIVIVVSVCVLNLGGLF